jgi:hypothetical protein
VGNKRETEIKKLWGYALVASLDSQAIVRETLCLGCVSLTHDTTHTTPHTTTYFFFTGLLAAFFAAALPLAVYGYFLPFTIGMLLILAWH